MFVENLNSGLSYLITYNHKRSLQLLYICSKSQETTSNSVYYKTCARSLVNTKPLSTLWMENKNIIIVFDDSILVFSLGWTFTGLEKYVNFDLADS